MEAPPTRVWVTKDFDGRTTAIFDRKFLIDEEVEYVRRDLIAPPELVERVETALHKYEHGDYYSGSEAAALFPALLRDILEHWKAKTT